MLSGKCACEGVRFEIDGKLGPIMFCHCSRCRRSTGSAFVSAASVKLGSLRVVAGNELLREWENCYLCSRCGSMLYGESKEYGIQRVRIGTIDGDPGSRPIAHIFVGSKAVWDSIPDDGLKRFEESAPLEYFMPG